MAKIILNLLVSIFAFFLKRNRLAINSNDAFLKFVDEMRKEGLVSTELRKEQIDALNLAKKKAEAYREKLEKEKRTIQTERGTVVNNLGDQ